MLGDRCFGEAALGEHVISLPVRGSRLMTTAAAAALQQAVVPGCLLFEAEFQSGTVRFTNGDRSVIWNGNEYIAVGTFGTVSGIEETGDLAAIGINVTLSAVPPEMLSLVLGEHYQGRTARVYLALFSLDWILLTDPILLFAGRMDATSIVLGKTATITMKIESRLADWDRARIRRWTNEDQRTVYPSDRGLEFVAAMVQAEIVWGRG